MKSQKKYLQIIMLCLLWISYPVLNANNIALSNIRLSGQDVEKHTSLIGFDIAWENSWRNDLPGQGYQAPYNYDAAWVFVGRNEETRNLYINHRWNLSEQRTLLLQAFIRKVFLHKADAPDKVIAVQSYFRWII